MKKNAKKRFARKEIERDELEKLKMMYATATAEEIARASTPKTPKLIEFIDGKKVDRPDNKNYRQSARCRIVTKKMKYSLYHGWRFAQEIISRKICPNGDTKGWRLATSSDHKFTNDHLVELLIAPEEAMFLGCIDFRSQVMVINMKAIDE